MKAKDISIPMEKQYNPIPSRERIVVTKVNKFFKEKSFKKDNEPIDNWAKIYPKISDEKIRKRLEHSTNCVFVIHDSDKGLINTEFLKNIFASNTNRKYAIIRKKYYNECRKEFNHTFLVEKKDNDDKIKIYDSWYLTNKRACFDKCFDANIEDNCEFSMTIAQQHKAQGVCALFALGTYLSLRSGQIKNLSKILKHFNYKISIIETNEIKKRAKWQQNPRFGLGLRY